MSADQQLTMDQAIANISAVVASYKGTLGEHMALQNSMKMLIEALKNKEEK